MEYHGVDKSDGASSFLPSLYKHARESTMLCFQRPFFPSFVLLNRYIQQQRHIAQWCWCEEMFKELE